MTTPTAGAPQATRRRTTEQERGDQAWDCISEVKRKPGSYQKEYSSRARSLNAMVQINGLGQTLAFLQAKGAKTESDKRLFEHLSAWIATRMGQAAAADLLTWLIHTASTEQYRRATAECLAFGVWLRRFAEAELWSGD